MKTLDALLKTYIIWSKKKLLVVFVKSILDVKVVKLVWVVVEAIFLKKFYLSKRTNHRKFKNNTFDWI